MFGSELNLIDLFLTLLLTMFLVSMVIKFSSKIGMLDIPNDRSSHVAPTPRGAGVAMFFGYMIVLTLFHTSFFIDYIGFFLALSLIFGIGVYDDNKGVSPKLKFIFIIAAALLIFFVNDFKIDTLGNWFGVELQIHWLLALPLTIFAIVGFTNALNLLDGLDGLAGSVSLIIFLSFAYIGYVYEDNFIATISIMMIVSLVAFLFFNWNPASIFMGDSGSLVLGFAIASVAIKAIDYISVTSVLLLTALPIVDTLVVMTRRMQRGLSPFNPDKTHIHHKMLTWRGSVDHSVMILMVIQIVFSFIGLMLREHGDESSFFLYILILYLFFKFLDERKLVRDRLTITRIKRKAVTIIQEDISAKVALMLLSALILILFIIRLFIA
ncbi:MAG: undecaprenyl/decaprenyl-phosphate alpha-N-acetylglucosaminyl 1-phosphate transferase [Epsilonproteobacteria bacterium]|nr:undecaprenyl/decaprenyl-phosphate alpha-N-acetylglucosaminyl 1-phosphate transferase [Campylobacterota bacterium]